MKKIRELLHRDLQVLDEVIHEDLDSQVELIGHISAHIIKSGGKRLRPMMTILCGRVAGYNNTNNKLLYKMAAMIEYIHTATLLHDDVVDNSGLRRGYKTANALFGNPASVLVGDFIYTRAFQMMVAGNSLRLLEVMANSTNQIAEGEVMQLLNIGRHDLTEEEYLKVIHAKTAVLFESAAKVAAIVSNADAIVEQHLATYAFNVGTAFQIVDDVLDYIGDSRTMGKNVGDDIMEGKVTLPLIYLLKHATQDEKTRLVDAITNPHPANIEYVVNTLKTSQAVQSCVTLATNLATIAGDALAIFPQSIYKDAMLELAQTAINRVQ